METSINLKSDNKQSRLSNYFYSLNDKYILAYEAFLLKFSPYLYARQRYKNIYGKKPNFKNPVTSDEKLLWLNLYWRHPLKTECADKYTMRSYVQSHGWGHILPEILGMYEKSSDIDFDSLPNEFVLKCTHGCGFNIFCKDKKTLDKAEVIRKLDKWMAADYSRNAGELHYTKMKPRIICEPFLNDLVTNLPIDYKVYCFNGKAHCILVVKGRDYEGHNITSDFYDIGWNKKLSYHKESLTSDRHIPKPEAHDEMIDAAEALSKPFPFVRMDFYNIKGKAVLGEMTFTPGGCIISGYTELGQSVLGSLIELPPRIA